MTISESLRAFFETEDIWHHLETDAEGSERYMLVIPLPAGLIITHITWEEEERRVHYVSTLGVNAPKERIECVMRLFNKLNGLTRSAVFWVDCDDGTLTARTSGTFDRDAEILERLKEMLSEHFTAINIPHSAILRVLYGGLSDETAVEFIKNGASETPLSPPDCGRIVLN